mmetsp:Transcript_32119/g.67949  ORF Transcript_32119/g.67949 Transcript_32119/m.67949 type:complete len:417 (+) Transcript_32119:313-1563(+)
MRGLPLLLSITIYFISSLGGVSIVKLLNYHYCFVSWWIFALLSRSTWILSAVFHCILQYREGISLNTSRKQLGLYCLVAVGLSLVEVVNSFSMSILPGSLYMLLKGSDVGWSMILSYFLLKKKSCYSVTKLLAAALIILGIGAVLVVDVVEDKMHLQQRSSDASTASMSVSTAAILCLGGAMLNSLCSVGTEAMLKQTLKEEQDRLLETHQDSSSKSPSKLLLSNAYSMYTSFFSFGLLLIPLSIFSRREQYNEDRYLSISSNSTSSCPDATNIDDTYNLTAVRVTILICLALLAISRFLERLCKHFICVYDSAVTFSMAQAARRWLGIYIVGWMFREEFAKGMIIGSLISGVGFVLHGYDASKNNTAGKNSDQQFDYKKLASSLNLFGMDDTTSSASEEIELPGKRPCTTDISGG